MRCFLTLTLTLTLTTAVYAAEPPAHRVSGDLAIQARDILKRYCSECHTGSAEPGKSKLSVMDHKQVVEKKTPIAIVASEGPSQLLELVKDGSMPPANKPGPSASEIAILEKWVNAKAPAYPPVFDERTTLIAIADDFERADANAVENLRYISFAHLIRDGQPLPNLVAVEQQLREAFAIATSTPIFPVPVDAAATVFRVDLSRLGWRTRELFSRMEGRIERGVVRLQPYDLLLLEYPHAQALATSDPLATRLERLLTPATQARPIPFVRGDWLATALSDGKNRTPLAEDIRSLVALEKALTGKELEPDGPDAKPFAGAKPYVGSPPSDGRTPIVPLSSLYISDIIPAPAPFALTAELIVADKVVADVKVEQQFKLRVTSNRRVNFALLMVQADGEVRIQEVAGGTILSPNIPKSLAPNSGSFSIAGITGKGNTATEHFVLFASESELPLPTIVRSKHTDKQIWRFLLDPIAKEQFDPSKVLRKVIPIKVMQK